MPVNVDDGLEYIRWIHGVLRSSPKPKKGLFFAIGEGWRFFVVCFLHSSAQICLCQTLGRRPLRITRRFVNTVTKGWVGAPNERATFRFRDAVVGLVDQRATFRFRDAVVGSVDQCLSRTRNLATSNQTFG